MKLWRTERTKGMQKLDSRIEHSLEPIVARWADQDKGLLFPLFQLIASGKPHDDARLAENLGRGKDSINAVLSTSLAEIDSHGHVSELFGITGEPTPHRIEVGEITLYSCCALVAHTVPAIMQQAVTVESIDPINGSKIKLAISADSELQYFDPMTACGSMVDCAVEEVIASPRTKFCCHVKHFATSESAREFSNKSPARYVMTIEGFHEAAQWLYRRIWR
ncbi:MAG: organomercurial lyase [Woeseia sp.]